MLAAFSGDLECIESRANHDNAGMIRDHLIDLPACLELLTVVVTSSVDLKHDIPAKSVNISHELFLVSGALLLHLSPQPDNRGCAGSKLSHDLVSASEDFTKNL